MGRLLIALMIGGGAGIAALILRFASARQRTAPEASTPEDAIAFTIAAAGARSPDDARRHAGCPPPPGEIDLTEWASRLAGRRTVTERLALLERCVRIAATMNPVVPLKQYSALLDLTFALGFHADALARIRDRCPFDYVDPARAGRPRSAEGRGISMILISSPEEQERSLRVLELTPPIDRQALVQAYRRLVGVHHPDRFHDATEQEREAAAERFIAITQAFEKLLPTVRQ